MVCKEYSLVSQTSCVSQASVETPLRSNHQSVSAKDQSTFVGSNKLGAVFYSCDCQVEVPSRSISDDITSVNPETLELGDRR